ncbi:uncharacterized protein LOC141719379 isoform X1 [Apium graveolens]|uniref:uncharacterized protein LOC141719379 isoform X1 n=1 Tax=Apium graveolens TaxID=4045 RepID=UPI003D7B133E
MMEFLRCFRYGDTHLGGDIFDKVLGVDKNASQREIQKAFHKLSFRYHPDKNNNKGTQEKFAEINNGFNCRTRVLLRSLMTEKQELCFSVVSLLWYKLVAAPETQPTVESTSAQQGWRQMIELNHMHWF